MENIEKLPMMGFMDSIKTVFGKLLDFNGRARRSELWWSYLAIMVVSGIVQQCIANPWIGLVIAALAHLLLLAVTVRRMHDRNMSGIWPVVSFILTTYQQSYLMAAGLPEKLNTVNPNPDEIFQIFNSPLIYLPTIVLMITNLVIFITCVLDSKQADNKYGQSPKYQEIEAL